MIEHYETSPQILNSDGIMETINFLKEIFNKIQERYLEIKTKKEELKYEKEVKSILKLMEEISDSLEENPLFKDNEYYDFLMIRHMIKYVLEDIRLFLNFSEFVDELIISFKEIIQKKIQNELENEKIDYENEYSKFDAFLFEKKEFFYLNIHQPHGKYNDLICDITNMNGED